MTAKKCSKCGKQNPHFFTHCIDCGAVLESDTGKPGKTREYITYGLVIGISLILLVFVIIPFIQYSMASGQDFSASIKNNSAEELHQIHEYALNEPVDDNYLQIIVISARDGQNTYNSNKFFIVSVNLKNLNTAGNIQVSNGDFELIDSDGTRYFPYGIGSKVLYDLSPTESSFAELTFIIPQKVSGKKIQFTFPGTTRISSNRDVVIIVF
jgi:hypothetical protein